MKKTGGYIFVILSSIGFGLSPLLASFVTAYGVGSIMMTFMNTIFLIPLFLILCLAAKKPLSISRRQFCSIFTLALLSGVFYGFYVLYLDKSGILEEMGYLSFTFWMMLISSVILLPVTILFGQFSFAIPPAGWLFSLLFALDTGFVAVVFLEIGIVRIGSMRASILGAVEPITFIAAGAFS